jgi:hypothetical protein
LIGSTEQEGSAVQTQFAFSVAAQPFFFGAISLFVVGEEALAWPSLATAWQVIECGELLAWCSAKEVIEVFEGHSCGNGLFTKGGENCLRFFVAGKIGTFYRVTRHSHRAATEE